MKNIILRIKGILLTTLSVLVFLFSNQLDAQQIPQFTQYMFNNYLSNPAVAGTYNYYQIRLNNRYQWVGMNDAPQTNSISFFGPLSKKDMGWGGYIYTDITGPTSKMGVMGSYSYNMRLNDEYRISGGLSFGFMQYKLDGSKLTLGDNFVAGQNDPAISKASLSTFTPDASLGFYMYSSLFQVGISAHQLFGQKLKLYQDPIGVNRLRQHIMISGSTRIILDRYYDIEPGLLLKYMYGSPFQFELNTKITYKKEMWGGLSWRFKDAIAILIGYNYKKRYLIGYSFDYSYTGIRKYQSGSHEIMIGYLFDKIK
jgi:type IX secretion system PorP/SprF family membrane protein